MTDPLIQAASKDAGNRTNYTNSTEWRAAWRAAHPTARSQMGSGGHDYEFCYLPDANNLNVAGFDHELNRGWVASSVPSNVQAGFFTAEEAREAFRRSLKTAAPKEGKGKTMPKVKSKTKATAEFKDSPWQRSKWWPKDAHPDDDPFKLAFSDMVEDAIKAFPATMKTALGRHLRDPFDQIENFVYEFEDFLSDIHGYKLEDLFQEIVDTANSLAVMHEMFVVTATKFAPLSKKIDLAYDEGQAGMKKVASACAKIPAPVIRFGSGNISVRVVNGTEFTLGTRDAEFDFDDEHRFRLSGNAVDDANTFVRKVINKMMSDDDQFTTDLLLGTTAVSVQKGKLDPSILLQSGDNEEASSLTAVAEEPTTAAPKDSSNYTYFKLRTNKLTVNRRGKEHVFRKGDPLGWRFSSSGKFLRLISPLTGPNIIFSVEITDQVLKWLDKQDPNAKRKLGQRKSDKPEDGNNRLEGYVVTDGKWYYRLDPKPVRSRKAVPEVIHPKEQSAKQMVRRFPDRKLKVQPVYSKDLGKVLSSVDRSEVVAAYDVYMTDLPMRDQSAHNEKVKGFLADVDRNLKKNGYTRTGSSKRSAMAEVTYKKGTDSVSLNYHHGTGRYGNVKAFLDLLFNDKIVAQAPLYAPSLSELVQSHDEAMKVALRWSQKPVTPK